MDTAKKTKIGGLLIVTGMVAGILSVAPAIDSTEYLTLAHKSSSQVISAVIFQFILSLSYMTFAILIYPLIKRYGSSLSLGFLCFRILAVSVSIIGGVLLISIYTVSEQFVHFGSSAHIIFSTLGTVLKTTRDVINHLFMVIMLGIGNIMLYLLLFRAKLTVRWIPLWGMSGAVLSIIASALILLNVVDIITPVYLILNMPTALFDLFFGLWLIFKGLDI